MDRRLLKIAILPNNYKDHLSAQTVGRAIEIGLRKSLKNSAEIFTQPITDGGLGTAEILAKHFRAKKYKIPVHDPLMREIKAEYFFNPDKKIGLLDMASASGIHLLTKTERNPQKTTTYGVGEIIKRLIDKGAKKIFVGIGDSGTNDAGIGMAQALGYSFIDKKNRLLPRGRFPLKNIKKINFPKLNKNFEIIGLCDGNVKLLGKDSISLLAAPQKGATQEMAQRLEDEMVKINNLFKQYFNLNFEKIDRSGCGGGLAAGLMAFLNAKLLWGAEYLIKKLKIDRIILKQDLIIVAEGQLDFKTVRGKSPYIIAKKAQEYGIPVVVFTGCLGLGFEEIYKYGATLILVTDPLIYPFEDVKRKKIGKKYIQNKAIELGELIKVFYNKI
jgi:glycerate kinase